MADHLMLAITYYSDLITLTGILRELLLVNAGLNYPGTMPLVVSIQEAERAHELGQHPFFPSIFGNYSALHLCNITVI